MSKKWFCAGAGVILLMTLVCYIPAIQSGFIWDDDDYIINNQELRSIDGLRRIWFTIGAVPQYYPLVHTSFWLEYNLWQLQPLGYHLINVLLHAINSILVWLVLRRLKIPGAWLAALLFALHPVQVESVAWITERKNVLSGCFYLSSMLVYLRFIRLDSSPPSAAPPSDLSASPAGVTAHPWKFYLLALSLYLCALLSKTVTCTMPAAILLLVWWKRGRIDWSTLGLLIPFFLMGAGLGLITVWVEQQHVGAQGHEWAFSLGERFLIAGRALLFQVGKLFWPYNMSFIYPRWHVNTGIWWHYMFPVATTGVFISLWLFRRRLGKAPLTAVLFFACTLAPSLGFFDIYPMRYTFVADHYQYLACIGLISLCVAGIMVLVHGRGPFQKLMSCSLYAIVILMTGSLTWQRGHIYYDSVSLWKDTLLKNPECWMAYNNLGFSLCKQGRLDEGMLYFTKSLAINPNNDQAHYNLGVAYQKKGELDNAVTSYTKALAINPTNSKIYNNLGIVFAGQGKLEEAIVRFKYGLALNANDGEIHNSLAAAYFLLKNYRLAIIHCDKARELGYSMNSRLLESLKLYR